MSWPDRLFVTGTDTEVGKSVVSACLAAAWGFRALKPVASGVSEGFGEDATLLSVGDGHAPELCYRFAPPISPHRAAAEAGVRISLDRLVAWIRAREGARTLVEGAGGWRVPLGPDLGFRDLARALDWPVLVVAANRLGVLNHTLLTLESIERWGLPVAAVVLNDGPDAPADHAPARARNLEDLRALAPVPVLHLTRLTSLDQPGLRAGGLTLRSPPEGDAG